MKPRLLLLTFFQGFIISSALAATPQFLFNFNVSEFESGSNAINWGSFGGGGGTFKNSSAADTDYHSGDGLGVSGLSGDYSFNNTISTGMGNKGVGGAMRVTSGVSNFGGAVSFTLSMWYKTDGVAIADAARLFDYTSGSNGFLLAATTSGELQLTVNGTAATASSSSGGFASVSSWVFAAVTYDSATNTVKYYYGTTVSSAQLVGTATLNKGTVITAGDGYYLYVGNTGGYSRPLDAYIDNVAIYCSTTDSQSALLVTDIEALRMSAIPEIPSGWAFLGGIVVLPALVFAKRKREMCKIS